MKFFLESINILFTANKVSCFYMKHWFSQGKIPLKLHCMLYPCMSSFSSVQLLSHVWLFVIPWTAAHRLPCPSPTPGACSNSWPLRLWCHPAISSSVIPLLLLPSIFPSIRVFFNESVLHIKWSKYWSFSFSISPSNEYSGLISFRTDWFNLLADGDVAATQILALGAQK